MIPGLEIPERVLSAVLPLETGAGTRMGTCFVVAADEQHSYLVSCRHVVDPEWKGDFAANLKVAGQNLEKVWWDPAGKIDLVLLKTQRLAPEPLALGDSLGEQIAILGIFPLGYGKDYLNPVRGVLGGKGLVRDSSDFGAALSREQQLSAWELDLHNLSFRLEVKHSGSPVYCPKSRRVFAVASHKFRDGSKGLGLVLDPIRAKLRELGLELFCEQGPTNHADLVNQTDRSSQMEKLRVALKHQLKEKPGCPFLLLLHGPVESLTTRLVKRLEVALVQSKDRLGLLGYEEAEQVGELQGFDRALSRGCDHEHIKWPGENMTIDEGFEYLLHEYKNCLMDSQASRRPAKTGELGKPILLEVMIHCKNWKRDERLLNKWLTWLDSNKLPGARGMVWICVSLIYEQRQERWKFWSNPNRVANRFLGQARPPAGDAQHPPLFPYKQIHAVVLPECEEVSREETLKWAKKVAREYRGLDEESFRRLQKGIEAYFEKHDLLPRPMRELANHLEDLLQK